MSGSLHRRAARVFVSSTFQDMHRERDILARAVFPRLYSRFAPTDLSLFDVDLRWGITQELAETHGALDLCLLEIDRCSPLFFCMLGQRYGWSPPHQEFSFTELEIRRALENFAALEGRSDLRPIFFLRSSTLSSQIQMTADNPGAMDDLRRRVHSTPQAEIHEYSNFEEFERQAEAALASLLERWKSVASPRPILSWQGVPRASELKAIEAATSRRPAVITGERNAGLSWLGTEWVNGSASPRDRSAVIDCRKLKGERGVARAVREIRVRNGSISAATSGELLELSEELLSLGVEMAVARGNAMRLFIDHFEEAYPSERQADLNAIPFRLNDALKLLIATRSERCVKQARESSLSVVEIGALERESVREFSKAYLGQYGKHLTSSQFERLASSTVCSAVGSLVLCLDELRRFHSHELLDSRLQRLASLPGHHEVCLELVDGLRQPFGDSNPDAVERVLIALSLSVNGLEEVELCAACGNSGAERLPAHVWTAIRASLSRCLVTRGALVDLAEGGVRQIADELRAQRKGLATQVGAVLLENLARTNHARWVEEAPNIAALLGGTQAVESHLSSVMNMIELHQRFPNFALGWLDILNAEQRARVFGQWEAQLAPARVDAGTTWELGLLAARCGSPANARVLWAKARTEREPTIIHTAIEALLLRDSGVAERTRLAFPDTTGRLSPGDRWVAASTMLALAAEGLTELSKEAESAWIDEAEHCAKALHEDALGAHAWILIGQLNIGRARWKRAFEAFDKAISFARRSGHARRLCTALERRALVAIELHKFSKARDLAAEALTISRECGLFEQECHAFESLIEIERQRADWPLAFGLAEQYILRTRVAGRNLDRAKRCLLALEN